MFKHILVPVDGSPTSMMAVSKAAGLAKAFGSAVTILYVIDPYPFTGVGADFAYGQAQYLSAATAEANAALDAARTLGRPVDIAVNHDREAISLHTANHPQTRHFCSDVFEVNPLVVTEGQPVGLLWASPDCKHFSKAKGGKPVSKKIRSLAWVVVKWAKLF